MTITALPTPPTRSDPANFADRADTFLAALPTFVTEANATAADVNADEIAAAASAAAAAGSAAAALVSENAAASSAQVSANFAGATIWISGTTYAIGDVRYSPATGLIFRRLTAGAGTTDPAADPTNWLLISINPGISYLTLINQGVI